MKIIKITLCSILFLFTMFISKSLAYTETMCIVTAYYSPLPNQSYYSTGSFERETRLNGNGTHGASGKAVFTGMLAAPSKYTFGTKIYIEGLGVGEVADRGGAIVPAGQRGYNYDRLDVWMGHGEEGLYRALAWGKRTIPCRIYDQNSNVSVNLNYSHINIVNRIQHETTRLFNRDLSLHTEGEDVKKLQEMLKNINLYNGDINGKYDTSTYHAVINLQKQVGIINTDNDFGAGYVGPKTMQALQTASNNITIETKDTPQQIIADNNNILIIGNQGEQVRDLQIRLKQAGFFHADTTGYFGEKTHKAVLDFQKNVGLITNEYPAWAGQFGPTTNNYLEEYINNKFNIQIDNKLNQKLKLGDNGQEVAKLQQILKEKGYLKIEPTGYFGEITFNAVIKYQKDNNLGITGKLDFITLEALNLKFNVKKA